MDLDVIYQNYILKLFTFVICFGCGKILLLTYNNFVYCCCSRWWQVRDTQWIFIDTVSRLGSSETDLLGNTTTGDEIKQHPMWNCLPPMMLYNWHVYASVWETVRSQLPNLSRNLTARVLPGCESENDATSSLKSNFVYTKHKSHWFYTSHDAWMVLWANL